MVSIAGFNLKTKAFIGIMRLRRKQFDIDSLPQEDAYTVKHFKRHSDAKKSIKMCIANVLAVRPCLLVVAALPLCRLTIWTGFPRGSSDGNSGVAIHRRQLHLTPYWPRSCHASQVHTTTRPPSACNPGFMLQHGQLVLHARYSSCPAILFLL